MKSLAELDSVTWSKLHHAYGAAADVPELIRAWASPEKASPDLRAAAKKVKKSVRDHVEWCLWGNVFHQGTRWQVSAHVVPFIAGLLDAAPKDDAEGRRFLVNYLAGLALGYPEDMFGGDFDPEGFFASAQGLVDPGGAPDHDNDRLYAVWARDTYEAVEADLEVVLARARDADEETALEALALLAWFPRRRALTAPVLTAIAREADGARAGHAIVSLAYVDPGAVVLADTLMKHADLVVAIPAACARVLVSPDDVGDDVVERLCTDLGELRDRSWAHTGELGALVSRCLARLPAAHTRRAVQAIARQHRDAEIMLKLSLGGSLLRVAFPDGPAPKRADALSDVQRDALECIRDHGAFTWGGGQFGNYADLLRRWGLPTTKQDLTTWLAR